MDARNPANAADTRNPVSTANVLGHPLHPILVAFLYQTLIDLTDEALDLFDRCLAEAYHRAGRDLKEFRLAVARSTNEKVRLFREIGQVVLDPQVRDADLRRTIYRRIPPAELRAAV